MSVRLNVRSLWSTARLIWHHPLAARDRAAALRRWARWQLGSRLLPGAAVVPFVDDAVLLVERGMVGATGNIYVGLHELADMAFVAHALRAEDLFVDVGANVGSYTVLASRVRGATTIAVEPLPATFARLTANVRINGIEDRVTALNVGLARQPGSLQFTRSLDCMNHVARDGGPDSVEVPVTTLDAITDGRTPIVVKIDVEGFETEVLAGADRMLAQRELRAMIVELGGMGARYGFDEGALRDRIEHAGFRAFTYDPFARTLCPAQRIEGNALYLRDVDFVRERVRAASGVRVIGTTL